MDTTTIDMLKTTCVSMRKYIFEIRPLLPKCEGDVRDRVLDELLSLLPDPALNRSTRADDDDATKQRLAVRGDRVRSMVDDLLGQDIDTTAPNLELADS